MQEKFALRKTLKKVAAIGTSLAMVGVTLSGALAAGLGDYGTTFSKTNTVVVFGEAGTDSVSVSDVVAGLPGGAAVPGEVVAGALNYMDDFEVGEVEDFGLGTNLTQSVAFGKTCFNDNDDLGLVDWEQNINIDVDKDYDVHEEFCFGRGVAVPRLTSSLAENDDDLGTEPIIMIPKNGLNYSLVFEENLDAKNRISNATTSKQITIENFMGKKLKISSGTTGDNRAVQFTALVGTEYQMHSGDTLTSDDCTINLLAIDANEVLLSVNGETKSVDEDSNARFGDCEVHIDSAIETTDGEGIAVVFVGDQASETFKSGDEAPGEEEDHHLWEWVLANLDGARPMIGVHTAESFTSDRTDLEDEIMDLNLLAANRRHLKVGDYICMPNYHECLILEGPKSEYNRCTITIDATTTETLPGFSDVHSGGSATYTDAKVLEFDTSGCGADQGLKVDTDGSGTVDQETDRVLVFWDSDLNTRAGVTTPSGEILVYYEKSNGNETLVNRTTTQYGWNSAIANSTLATESMLFEFDYDDFDNAEIKLWEIVNSTSGVTANPHGNAQFARDINDSTMAIIKVEIGDEGGVTGGSKEALWFEVGLGSGINKLGNEVGEDTTKWLRYGGNSTGANNSIASFDEDVLSNSGVIMVDVEDNYNDDKIVLKIPDDDEFEYWVRVARPKAGVVSVSGAIVSGSVSMSDSEVTDVASLGKHVVVVGGPAVNSVAADLLGVDFPTYGDSLAGLEEGTAVLEMKTLTGGKSAVLAYGWEQDDTRRAAVLLRDPAELAQKLTDAGLSDADSVTVTGTDFAVAGITVSA